MGERKQKGSGEKVDASKLKKSKSVLFNFMFCGAAPGK